MKQLRVNASTSYDILIAQDLLSDCGRRIRPVTSAAKAVIVTDDIVDGLYRQRTEQSLREAGFETEVFVFPHGEASKCHTTLIKLYDFLCEKDVTRSDLLVALGGGVTGDLTGFCAATYLRGIDYVQIPTTLLAQIDSSVGGKTAVDTAMGKNLVGAFKQPLLVLCDTGTLDTLSPEIFSDGMAEAVKYGLIRDESLFRWIMEGDIRADIDRLIYECVRIKAEIVEADEFDKGERMLLNFGHTIGHAIERQYQYEAYTHGSAVGIGMVWIARIFEKEGLTPSGTAERIVKCLEKYGLPCSAVITPEQIYQYSIHDKKRSKQDISLVILEKTGKAVIHKVPVAQYRRYLEELAI